MITYQEHLKLRAVEVLNERIERQITPVGELLPEHTVKTFAGQEHPIGELHKDTFLVLAFLRASWCPYCRAHLTMLEGMADTFEEFGCKIVAISRESPEESIFEAEKVTMITDETNAFGKKLNMTYYATEQIAQIYQQLGIEGEVEGYWDTSELNVPATYIVSPQARILYKHAKRDYTQRSTGSELICELSRFNNA